MINIKIAKHINFRSKFGLVLLKYTSSNIFSNVIKLISGFIIARYVSPVNLGIFNSVQIYLNYSQVAQLGIQNGLSREYPFYMGKKDFEYAKKITSVANLWFLMLAIIVFTVFLFNGLRILIFEENSVLGFSWITYAFVGFAIFYGTMFLKILFRSNTEFNLLAYNNIIRSLIGLVLLIPVYLFSIFGVFIKNIFTNLYELLFLYIKRPVKLELKWDKQVFKALLFTGFPIFFVRIIDMLWPVIDRTLVLRYGGVKELGLYSIALFIVGAFSIIPQSVFQIIYPKLSIAYGANDNKRAIIKQLLKYITLTTFLIIPISGLFYFILPYIITNYIPKYTDSIAVCQIIIWLPVITNLLNINIIFNIFKRQKDNFIASWIGFGGYLITLYFLAGYYGFELTTFGAAMITGKFISLLFNFTYIYKYYRRG